MSFLLPDADFTYTEYFLFLAEETNGLYIGFITDKYFYVGRVESPNNTSPYSFKWFPLRIRAERSIQVHSTYVVTANTSFAFTIYGMKWDLRPLGILPRGVLVEAYYL